MIATNERNVKSIAMIKNNSPTADLSNVVLVTKILQKCSAKIEGMKEAGGGAQKHTRSVPGAQRHTQPLPC